MKKIMKGFMSEERENVIEFGSYEEFRKFAEAEGINLTGVELENVEGGTRETDGEETNSEKCPKCGSTNTYVVKYYIELGLAVFKCRSCGHIWQEIVF